MIRKLKKKFILLATVSTFLLMSALVGTMNLINYTSVVKEADTVLEVLSQPHDPFGFGFMDGDFKENPKNDELHNTLPEDKPIRPRRDGDRLMPKGMSPEVPYESRFFTAIVSDSGEVQESDFSRIVSVEPEAVETYVAEVLASRKERGFIDQFRFIKLTSDDSTRIMFLDCGRRLNSFRTFMWTSMAVGMFGCVIVFVIFLFAAGRIVRPIAESYEKQKRFITDAGHEIKTPLTIISANVDLLEADLGEHESIADIRTQTARLSALTGELVYLSKMEEAEDSLRKVEFPVSDLIAEEAGAFHAIARASNKELTLKIEENITMNGAPDAICRLVSILLDNAMKYSPEGGNILLNVASRRKELVMTVSNPAIRPVTAENLARLFERFYRADASRNSQTGGHGIGLSVAKAIVNAHGGKISASSWNGSDFIVNVILPLV